MLTISIININKILMQSYNCSICIETIVNQENRAINAKVMGHALM